MILVETVSNGKPIRTETVPNAEIAFPPVERSIAAAKKAQEIMSKENVTLEQAMKRPEFFRAARDAVVGQREESKSIPKEAAEAKKEAQKQIDEMAALYRRYLLSIANQHCENFDSLTNSEIEDLLLHPRYTCMRVLSFDEWAERAKD